MEAARVNGYSSPSSISPVRSRLPRGIPKVLGDALDQTGRGKSAMSKGASRVETKKAPRLRGFYRCLCQYTQPFIHEARQDVTCLALMEFIDEGAVMRRIEIDRHGFGTEISGSHHKSGGGIDRSTGSHD